MIGPVQSMDYGQNGRCGLTKMCSGE